jgi:hypothetical protein
MSGKVHFEGTCDVCGQTITFDFDYDTQGIIDSWIDEDSWGTWIRHIGGPDPNCSRYSSQVTAKQAA